MELEWRRSENRSMKLTIHAKITPNVTIVGLINPCTENVQFVVQIMFAKKYLKFSFWREASFRAFSGYTVYPSGESDQLVFHLSFAKNG